MLPLVGRNPRVSLPPWCHDPDEPGISSAGQGTGLMILQSMNTSLSILAVKASVACRNAWLIEEIHDSALHAVFGANNSEGTLIYFFCEDW